MNKLYLITATLLLCTSCGTQSPQETDSQTLPTGAFVPLNAQSVQINSLTENDGPTQITLTHWCNGTVLHTFDNSANSIHDTCDGLSSLEVNTKYHEEESKYIVAQVNSKASHFSPALLSVVILSSSAESHALVSFPRTYCNTKTALCGKDTEQKHTSWTTAELHTDWKTDVLFLADHSFKSIPNIPHDGEFEWNPSFTGAVVQSVNCTTTECTIAPLVSYSLLTDQAQVVTSEEKVKNTSDRPNQSSYNSWMIDWSDDYHFTLSLVGDAGEEKTIEGSIGYR